MLKNVLNNHKCLDYNFEKKKLQYSTHYIFIYMYVDACKRMHDCIIHGYACA